MEINSNHSTYGAAFRQKPIFFMSGKETVAFFEGKLKKNMTLQEDSDMYEYSFRKVLWLNC